MIPDTSHLFRQAQIGFSSGSGGEAAWGREGSREEQNAGGERGQAGEKEASAR